ncbi:unnamed protein product [Rhizoctonia solani]|uniref:Peptidase C14 caspase domain-containing protein n=1 Tax=Rhizoctonia solani TaxID=456999 RepID=A0A8H3AV17_9AGAM|nr:unnamed protein product [Rhizoctonia solani]
MPDEVELKPTSTDRETPTTNAAGFHKLKYPFSQNLSQNKNSSKLKPPILHGLIVGINKYKQSEVHPDLLGCVSDAKSMLNYFTGLGIPKDRFLCLYDEDATRDAILKAFVNNLTNNPNIQKFDPIVIYFAGYGDRVQAPRGWQTVNGFAGMILPHDTSTFDALGHYIHGIPDLTLAFLLYRLSQDKGNNITPVTLRVTLEASFGHEAHMIQAVLQSRLI